MTATVTTLPNADQGTFSWDEMLAPVDAPAAVTNIGAQFTVDSVPAPIRQRVETSLDATMKALKAVTDKGGKATSVPPQWKLQPVPSAKVAEEFVKHVTRYAMHRPSTEIPFYVAGCPVGQITVRRGIVHYGTDSDVAEDAKRPEKTRLGTRKAPEGIAPGWYVRYAAKPLEVRKGAK